MLLLIVISRGDSSINWLAFLRGLQHPVGEDERGGDEAEGCTDEEGQADPGATESEAELEAPGYSWHGNEQGDGFHDADGHVERRDVVRLDDGMEHAAQEVREADAERENSKGCC